MKECPSGKTPHQTKQQAFKQIENAQKRGAPKKLLIYKCPHCKHFHITKGA